MKERREGVLVPDQGLVHEPLVLDGGERSVHSILDGAGVAGANRL
jgi:hypothetical protein